MSTLLVCLYFMFRFIASLLLTFYVCNSSWATRLCICNKRCNVHLNLMICLLSISFSLLLSVSERFLDRSRSNKWIFKLSGYNAYFCSYVVFKRYSQYQVSKLNLLFTLMVVWYERWHGCEGLWMPSK